MAIEMLRALDDWDKRKKVYKSSIKLKFHLLIVSLYLSGIYFLGYISLVEKNFIMASISSISVLILYWILIKICPLIIERIKIIKPGVIYISAILSIILFSYSLIIPQILSINLSARIFFYSIIFLIVVFLTTFFAYFLELPVLLNKKEMLKIELNIKMEVFKSLIFAITLLLFGAAYVQIISGTNIDPLEMLLDIYTVMGVLILVLVPFTIIILKTMIQLEEEIK